MEGRGTVTDIREDEVQHVQEVGGSSDGGGVKVQIPWETPGPNRQQLDRDTLEYQ